jgi:hypothetical protein
MADILLAKKTPPTSAPIATNDEAHAQLIMDPTVSAFPGPNDLPAAPTTTTTQGASTMTASFPTFGGAPAAPTPQINAQQDQSKVLQSTGGAMQEGGTSEIKADDSFSDFINKRWRPLMALIYMVTCTCDFVVFPVLWSVLQAYGNHGQVTSQWQPLTLQGAGLYHIAMGAVLGLAAYGRSQEKIAGKA